MSKSILIIGATSYIAQRCARIWCLNSPQEMILVARDMKKLEEIVGDLSVRSPSTKYHAITLDFLNPLEIKHFVDSLEVKNIDIALIAHGDLIAQQDCLNDLQVCRNSLLINGVSPVLFLEAIADLMCKQNSGVIAVIGSVAGDRCKKSNYTYGAAKALIDNYVKGMRHRLKNSNLDLIVIKPGPTQSPMTRNIGNKNNLLSDANKVAFDIVSGIESRKKVIYSPSIWRYIMLVIQLIPSRIFYKLDI